MRRSPPSSLLDRTRALLGVEAGEGARVGGLAALFAILTLGVIFVQAIAFALFIDTFGTQSLPASYVASAILASLAAFGFLKLAERISFARVLLLNVATLIVGCTLFWLGLTSPLGQWTIFLLPSWFQTQINLVTLAVWPLAGRLFDVRQAKRLLGLVGAGNWLANVAGGFVIAPLVALVGTSGMLLLAALITAAGLGLLWAILRTQLPSAPAPAPGPAARRPTPARTPAPTADQPAQGYVRLILAYVFLWWAAFFVMDNIFYDRAAVQYPDAAQLAQAIGLLLAVTGVVALFTALFLTSLVLRRYGLRTTLLAMPLLVGATLLALGIAGSLGQGGALLFWLAAFGKMVNIAWGFSLSQSALVLSYQPLPGERRSRIQTLAEGIVQPVAIGCTGLALIGLNTLLGLDAVGLAWFCVGIIALLIVVITLIGRQYPHALSSALARRQWGGGTAAALDQESLALLRQALRNPHPAAALYAMTMLDQADPAALDDALATLLHHPATEVRRAALERIERHQQRSFADPVRSMLATEPDPEVQAAAITSLAALCDPAEHQALVAQLTGPGHLRRGAVIGLLRYANGSSHTQAEQVLYRMAASPSPAERILAAQIIAETWAAPLRDLALDLLADQQAEVRREALKMAARAADPTLWPAVVQAAATPGASRMTAWALASGGTATLPAITAALARPDLPCHQLIALISACARIGGPEVIRLMLNRTGHPDGSVRAAALEALSTAGYRTDHETARAQVRAEAAQATWLAATIVDLGDNPETQIVRAALALSLRQARDRICLWLALAYDAPTILRARTTLASGPGARDAYAIEILDTQLPPDLKSLVLPIAEDLPAPERLARLAGAFPQPSQPPASRLQALISGPLARQLSAWTRACALFGAARLPEPTCLPAIRAALFDRDTLVAETAHWALTRLDPTATSGDPAMLSTIEKVIILKTVSVFGHTSDDVLADVAPLLEEVDVVPGAVIFQKGDLGDSLYIIVAGRVRVDDGDRLLNYLGERDVFGEMALLDAEPRVASVTAVEPTRLLRLDQAPFFELITDRPEVAIGLVRVLTGHLRARIRDVTQLSAQVQELRAERPAH